MRAGGWLLPLTLALLAVTAGCSGPDYPPPRSYADYDGDTEAIVSAEEPDYYVLAWSDLAMSGRRRPDCPYQAIEVVEVRRQDLSRSESWDEDKELASRNPTVSNDPYLRREHEAEGLREGGELTFPSRHEEKLLERLRQKARTLSGDAVVDIVIHRRGDGDGFGLSVQNLDFADKGDIETITGTVIKFDDPDCRH